jgi:hypothetical protein
MIYDFPGSSEPIGQGDIFSAIPRIDINLNELPILEGENFFKKDWLNISKNNDPKQTLVAIRPVIAIVITQDCDAVRDDDIALCEISSFAEIYPAGKDAKYPNKTMSIITTHSRTNLKWFYLPVENKIGFTNKMAVDFKSVLKASRTYLEKNVSQLRIARLNSVASEHFREHLSEYFRRYPYNEWYPLDKAEFEEYSKAKREKIEPYPGQE